MKFDLNFTKTFAVRFILEDSRSAYLEDDKILKANTFFFSLPFNICFNKTNYREKRIQTILFAMEIILFKIGLQIIRKYK